MMIGVQLEIPPVWSWGMDRSNEGGLSDAGELSLSIPPSYSYHLILEYIGRISAWCWATLDDARRVLPLLAVVA